jgi:hypothetical protein
VRCALILLAKTTALFIPAEAGRIEVMVSGYEDKVLLIKGMVLGYEDKYF